MESNIESLGVVAVFAWIIVGGAIGGAIDLAFKVDLEEVTEEGGQERSKRRCFAYKGVCLGFISFLGLAVVNGLIGAGGAVGVQFVLIGVQKFSAVATVDNQLLIFSIALVAGFSARRLLPQITDKLARDLDVTKKKAEEIEQKSVAIEETSKRLEKLLEKAEKKIEEVERQSEKSDIETYKILQALRPDAARSARQWAVDHLTRAVASDPKHREQTILLGRLHRFNHEYSKAIEVLTRFLEVKGDEEDMDYADVLYNRACYKSLLWKDTAGEDTALRDGALDDLTKSINIFPDNKEDAKYDKDFDPIKDIDEFKRLIE